MIPRADCGGYRLKGVVRALCDDRDTGASEALAIRTFCPSLPPSIHGVLICSLCLAAWRSPVWRSGSSPLRRSRSNRMVAGVVAGMAQYFGLDVTLARVLYVVISICSAAFPGVLVYLLFWILMPLEDSDPRVVSTQ